MNTPVKSERHDEAEIQEMAEKLLEANRAKTQMPVGGTAAAVPMPMQNISLTRIGKGDTRSIAGPIVCEPVRSLVDEESARGRFEWTTLGKNNIPYIIRSGENYCAVRMVELKVFNNYLSRMHQDIYNCTCIHSYYITETEGRLLNEINFKHCDYQFGGVPFTSRDLIIRLSDAVEFYNFLDACYGKLQNGSNSLSDRCGFIRINNTSVVPYTLCKTEKFVPLFYFEGETDNLQLKADKLEGWDLSYLKFCCKVQGIRNELFAQDSCAVVSLNEIKNFFPPETLFEDYWPCKVDLQLLNSGKTPMQMGQWIRQPPTPPVTLLPALSFRPVTQTKAARPTYGIASGSPRQMCPTGSSNIGQQAQPAFNRAAQPAAQSIYRQSTPQMNRYPPPLRHVNGGVRYDTPQSYYTSGDINQANRAHSRSMTNQSIINQQIGHQQSLAGMPQQSTTNEQRPNMTNGRRNTNREQSKLIPIPDPPTSGNHIPYKMQKALIESRMVPCINMKPYVYTDLLVTIPDLVEYLFNNVPVHSCHQVIELLGIKLYKGNNSQMRVLNENGKCGTSNDCVPLVQVRQVLAYMPQLKYMLGGNTGPEVPA